MSYRPKGESCKQTAAARRLKKLGAKETLFRLLNDPVGDWRTVKHPYNSEVRDYLIGKYGPLVIIANADFEAAARTEGAYVEVDNRMSDN